MKRWLHIVSVIAAIGFGATAIAAQTQDSEIRAFFKTYDAAFNAKDLDELAALYHPDVTIFEGSGINRGWIDYRDNHLGPELKSFQNLQ